MSVLEDRPSAESEDALIERYLAASARFKQRRLAGLIVLALLLIGTLIGIYAAGWYRLTGSATAGAAWIGVGVAVGAAAIVAVIIDIVYRRDS
ncbi:hypothetical protein ACX9R5_01585 [Rathayibacter sp. CAU 1779]